MTEKRVTVVLTEIFQDYRQKAFIFVRPEWKNIESLQTHIRNVFGIEFYIYLTSTEGILYPEAEKIAIIQDGSTLVVHKITLEEIMKPPTCISPVKNGHDSTEKSKKKKRKIQEQEIIDDDIKIVEIKVIESPIIVKKLSNSDTKEKASSSSDDDDDDDKEIQNQNFRVLQTVPQRQAPPSAINDFRMSNNGDSNPKRKRKRNRKRNKNQLIPVVEPKPSTSHHNNRNQNSTPRDTNKHIRFDNSAVSSSESTSESEGSEKIFCQFRTVGSEIPRECRPTMSFWSSTMRSYVDPTSITQPGISEVVMEIDSQNIEAQTPPVELALDIPKNDENLHDLLKEAEVPFIETPTTAKSTAQGFNSLEEMRKDIPNLNLPNVETLPEIGTVLGFKLLRMDDQCQPTISEYIIGSVKQINADECELVIELLAGKHEIGSRICKTVVTDDNQIATIEENQLKVNFSELIEPVVCLCF